MSDTDQNQKPYSLALTSTILAFIFLSLPAIICGHVAISRIKKNELHYSATDRRLAIGGLIVGYSGMVGWLYTGLLGLAPLFGWDLKSIFPFGVGI